MFKLNREVLLSVIRNLIVLFILVNIVATAENLNAQDIIEPEMGKIYFGYNKEPDSLLIDGTKITLSHKKLVEVSTGIHVVKAYLSCYKTIEQTTEVKNRRARPLRLKFKHLTTDDYDIYKNIRLQNYLSSLALVGISPLYAGGIVSLMPISLIGLTGQVMWQLKQSSYFNHCNGEYTNPNLGSSQNNFFFGIDTRIGGEFSLEHRNSFIKTFETPNTLVGIERYLKQEIIIAPNDDPMSSMGLTFGYQRQLNQKYHVSIHTNIYPYFVIKAVLYDENNINADFKNPSKISDRKNFFVILGADVDYRLVNRQNFILYFSFGGLISNTLSEKIGLEVIHPEMHYFDENPPLVYYDYSYSVKGASAGIKSNYALTDKFSFNMIYKLYFAQMLDLNHVSNQSFLTKVGVNFIYNF